MSRAFRREVPDLAAQTLARKIGGASGALVLAAVLGLAPVGIAGATVPPFTKVANQHFLATGLGPSKSQSCDIIYDLYVPNAAVSRPPYPAILTTNGFGGSKDDQSGLGEMMASRGYEVLSYSGLGFGGSSCNIEIDSPEWDGRAASQLVSLLGNRPEVLKDGPGDPRIGTWGGSYGGGFQFALASVDDRIDAMEPIITWNDLAYSLGPNNLSIGTGGSGPLYTEAPPGSPKYQWTELFFIDGMAQLLQHPGTSGNPPTTCPGFDATVCVANAQSSAAGYPTADTVSYLRHASAQYEFFNNPAVHRFPPALLIQGENDTLFNINEAAANYRAFKTKGAPVKLVLGAGGHSGPWAPGEVNFSDPSKGYLSKLGLAWFDHYLKGLPVSTGPEVEYFRDWVQYDTSGSAQSAYGSGAGWPVGGSKKYFLSNPVDSSGNGGLVPGKAQAKKGSASFASSPNSPTNYSEVSAIQTDLNAVQPEDAPGTFAAFSTAPLSGNVDVVGTPSVQVNIKVSVPPVDPSTDVVIFGKLYDVDASGKATMVHRLVAPVRIAGTVAPVRFNMPAIVHRYAAGHQIRLVMASSDVAYVNSRAANTVTVTIDPSAPSTLSLPLGGG
jgi:ABC-2 type transport system ATP-binding protein